MLMQPTAVAALALTLAALLSLGAGALVAGPSGPVPAPGWWSPHPWARAAQPAVVVVLVFVAGVPPQAVAQVLEARTGQARASGWTEHVHHA